MLLYDEHMIASLPMYDWPEVREATDAWWHAIAHNLAIAFPLDRTDPHTALWKRPDLLLSQTCGYPFTHEFAGKLKLVATPHYAADGCAGPDYQSIVLARRKGTLESFRGTTAAVNNADSMSGMLALKLVFAPLARSGHFFGRVIATGGHIRSMNAVRDGAADVCSIDAVCVAMARRYRPKDLEGLVEVARSPMVPGLPYVTIAGDVERLRGALDRAIADPALREFRDQLFLSGISRLAVEDYARITEHESAMQRAGGLELL
jgi:ABC-type phosphate/phosphonate transport system substrate-binding protein